MNRPLRLSLAVALALASSNVYALGLGVIEVRSKMNEPLVARIPVVVTAADEAEGLKVKLAGSDDFRRMGFDASGLSVPLEFTLSTDEAGNPVILVTSLDPVREPIMSFLVEANWANGRVLREYSVLLDPPVAPAIVGTRTVVQPVIEAPEPEPQLEVEAAEPPPPPVPAPEEPVAAAPAPVEPAPAEPAADPVFEDVEPTPEPAPEPVAEAPAEPESEPVPEPTPEPAPEAQAAEPEPAPPPAPEPAPPPPSEPGEYGPVASGETLWEIANNTRPTRDLSVNQMMVAILRANPDSFIDQNVNALKRGAILRIPSQDEVATLSQREAAAEIAAQHQAWSAPQEPALVADSGQAPPQPAPAAAAPAPADSRLELVPPAQGTGTSTAGDRPGTAGGTDTTAAIRADLDRTQEQLVSREQEASELRLRVGELEKIKADSDKLISFKDNAIAELQRRLDTAEAEVARLKAEQESAVAAAASAAKAEAEREAAAAAVAAAAAASAPDAETPATDAAPVEPDATEPPAETTAEATPTDAEPGIAGTETTPETAALETAPSDEAATADSGEPLAEATPEATPAEAATVTPLAEATPAELTPVSDAPAKPWYTNPLVMGAAGLVALLALLGLILRSRRPPAPAVIGEPRSSVADAFGAGVFGGAAGATADAAAADAASDAEEEQELLEILARDPTDTNSHLDLLRLYYARGDADKFEAAAGALYAQMPSSDSYSWEVAAEMGRSLCPGNALFEVSPPARSTAAAGEEFDFGSLDKSPPSSRSMFDTPTAPAGRNAPVADESFDFNLVESSPPPSPARPAEFDLSMDGPDLGTQQIPVLTPSGAPSPPAELFGGDDAVGTKLDLAKAYLDMGDPEGARSMLEEVVIEGTESQRAEAMRLLSDIG